MRTAAQKGGGDDGIRSTTGPRDSTPRAAATQVAIPDLRILRDRLVGARRRLLERIILEYDHDRAYPDTAWTRMVSDIHITIMAVDAVIAEGAP